MSADRTAEVVVLGGTGATGRALVPLLLGADPTRRVRLASRRPPDAPLPRAEHVVVDARRPASVRKAVAGARVVVDAAGLDDAGVTARAAVASGVHVVDLSADPTHLQRLERLDDPAHAAGVTVLTEVGLAPGLSNLLAIQARELAPEADRVDVTLTLGLGDTHGTAGTRWVLDQLAGGVVTLPGRSLLRTTGVPVATRLAFEPPWLATITSVAARSPLPLPLLVRAGPLVTCLTRRDAWSLEARTPDGAAARASGRGQAVATAVVAAWAVRRLLRGPTAHGVVPLHDVATIADLHSMLSDHGIRCT